VDRRPLLALTPFLLAACGHSPPAPPAGMGRLIVQCCELIENDEGEGHLDCAKNRVLDRSAVWIDGEERGTCANWRRDGAILATGRHVIQVKVPLDGPLQDGECCVDAGSYVTLHAGEIHTQPVGLKRFTGD